MGVKQVGKSLSARNSQLSDAFYQLKVLSNTELIKLDIPRFSDRIKEGGLDKIVPSS